MMGHDMMEWRIFFPLASASSSPVDVWSLLNLGEVLKLFKLRSEERRDVYISCTDSIGLKVRGQRELFEIKVRGQKYPCGAEEWSKVLGIGCTQSLDYPPPPPLYAVSAETNTCRQRIYATSF